MPESLVTFLTNPVMSALLIMLGLGGLFVGIKTGHFGSIALAGLAAIALFFGVQYFAELANYVEILMFLAGIILLAIEVFVIPGQGVLGFVGGAMMFASLFLALGGSLETRGYDSFILPLYTLAGSLLGLAIIIALVVRYMPTSSAFSRLILQSATAPALSDAQIAEGRALLGAHGVALTTLRPAGTAVVGERRYDVITEGEYIAAGEPIYIVRVEGTKVVVRRIDSPRLDQG